MLCTAAFTAVTITITFLVIKAIFGLRVSEEEEIIGLDATEHGLPSAYAGFSIMDIDNTMTMEQNANTNLGVREYDRSLLLHRRLPLLRSLKLQMFHQAASIRLSSLQSSLVMISLERL